MQRADVAVSADLHVRLLRTGTFPSLGVGFLRAYHRSSLASPHGIALMADVDGVPVGFLLGASPNRTHLRWVLRHRGIVLAVRGLLALLTRPGLACWFIRARLRRYVRGVLRLLAPSGSVTSSTAVAADPAPVAVLAHIAVEDSGRGSGAGRLLVAAFGAQATRHGATAAHVVTLAGSAGAGAFYARLGWDHVGDHASLDGENASEYRLNLGSVAH